MTIKEIRQLTKLTQSEFSKKYGMPISSLQNWEQGCRKCPDYVAELLEFVVKEQIGMKNDMISRSELLRKMNEFCKHQRYLIPEQVWNMVENMPSCECGQEKDYEKR